MLFTSNEFNRKKKIADLDNEILSLLEKKSQIEVEIQKLDLKLQDLFQRQKITERFIDLDIAIKQAETKLAMLNEEIAEETKNLDKLKDKCTLVEKCKSYEDMLEKLENNLQASTNSMLKNLFDKFPDVCSNYLDIESELEEYSLEIPPSYILLIIDAKLSEFAIDHNIDVQTYKTFIYSLNSLWFKEFDKLRNKKTIIKTSNSLSILFNNFLVLEDDN